MTEARSRPRSGSPNVDFREIGLPFESATVFSKGPVSSIPDDSGNFREIHGKIPGAARVII